jgi:hypothetical protein
MDTKRVGKPAVEGSDSGRHAGAGAIAVATSYELSFVEVASMRGRYAMPKSGQGLSSSSVS